ncbi:ABC transporter permease [Propioniciclava sp.]|uniref:ABC transporter permease n=1 Tax=Propioniciclava sp. TaxID=2038686 RepID=UPI00262C86CC|nr:ABC transporter permease [Propioniciclava sp.]
MNSLFPVALRFELDKMRRSNVVRIASLIVMIFPPLLAAAGVVALRADLEGAFAAKASVLVRGEGWEAYLGLAAQVLSVAALLGIGFVCAWSFGREFEENTIVNLFGLPIRRGELALAKGLALVAWVIALSLFAAVLVVLVGFAVRPGTGSLAGAWLPFVVSVLTGFNVLPVAWVATARRSYLPAVAVLLGLVVAVQLLMAVGVGAWFPWSVPGLLAGFSPTLRPNVVQCLLPLLVGALSVWAVVRAWDRLELGRS